MSALSLRILMLFSLFFFFMSTCRDLLSSLMALFAILLLVSVCPLSISTSGPRALAWSSKTYGPDGPWRAITVEIGSLAENVDLYPGGF
jgi:peptidoglycan/LPS O-acetylase OafA/YrhL